MSLSVDYHLPQETASLTSWPMGIVICLSLRATWLPCFFEKIIVVGSVLEPEVADDFKETMSFIRNRDDTHMNSRNCGSLSKTSTGSNQKVIALRRGNSHKLILPSRKLFSVHHCWQWENQSSPKECHKVYQPHSRTGHVLGVVGYNRKWILWGVFFCCFLSFV